jgi:hypothetical protein
MRRAGALAVALACAMSACGVHGLSFLQDDRIAIAAPHNRATVHLPFQLMWRIKDRTKPPVSYAVFVDGSPQPSGRTVAWLFRNRDACRGARRCPTVQMLTDAGITLTTATSLRIAAVAHRRTSETQRAHRVTVVVLDAAGRRIGENAVAIDFFVKGSDR